MSNHAMNRIGLIDAGVAGVSGDKILGALVDLGGSQTLLRKIGEIVGNCLPGTRRVEVKVESVERGDIASKLVRVDSKEDVEHRKGQVIRAALEKCSDRLSLSPWAGKFALATVDTLLSAESQVHGHASEEVELHELGSADTLVDVLGVAGLVDELGLGEVDWWSTPISVGGGKSHFSGRDYPNPPPAVAEILRSHNIPFFPGEPQEELTTPTGAAIAVNLAHQFSNSYPSFRPSRIGYGAGSREIKEVANVLRLTLGEKVDANHHHDHVVVLETNLDDVTGEVIGHAVERVMEAGARDVTVTSVYMKKNRPGHMFSVIVDAGRAEELASIVMQETGSLGVREIPVRRHITQRTVEMRDVELGGKKYPLRVKVALDKEGRVLSEKIEYEDRKRISEATGLGIREIAVGKKHRKR